MDLERPCSTMGNMHFHLYECLGLPLPRLPQTRGLLVQRAQSRRFNGPIDHCDRLELRHPVGQNPSRANYSNHSCRLRRFRTNWTTNTSLGSMVRHVHAHTYLGPDMALGPDEAPKNPRDNKLRKGRSRINESSGGNGSAICTPIHWEWVGANDFFVCLLTSCAVR